MTREDVRINLASWEADSERYQRENRPQLNRWDRLGWGVWDILEDEIHALGDVDGLDALELGCGACQFGIKVAMRGAKVRGLDFSANQLAHAGPNMEETGVRFPLVRASAATTGLRRSPTPTPTFGRSRGSCDPVVGSSSTATRRSSPSRGGTRTSRRAASSGARTSISAASNGTTVTTSRSSINVRTASGFGCFVPTASRSRT